MNVAAVREAQLLIGQLADLAMTLPPDGNGGDMALHLRVAELYLSEFTEQLLMGKNLREALTFTATNGAGSK